MSGPTPTTSQGYFPESFTGYTENQQIEFRNRLNDQMLLLDRIYGIDVPEDFPLLWSPADRRAQLQPGCWHHDLALCLSTSSPRAWDPIKRQLIKEWEERRQERWCAEMAARQQAQMYAQQQSAGAQQMPPGYAYPQQDWASGPSSQSAQYPASACGPWLAEGDGYNVAAYQPQMQAYAPQQALASGQHGLPAEPHPDDSPLAAIRAAADRAADEQAQMEMQVGSEDSGVDMEGEEGLDATESEEEHADTDLDVDSEDSGVDMEGLDFATAPEEESVEVDDLWWANFLKDTGETGPQEDAGKVDEKPSLDDSDDAVARLLGLLE